MLATVQGTIPTTFPVFRCTGNALKGSLTERKGCLSLDSSTEWSGAGVAHLWPLRRGSSRSRRRPPCPGDDGHSPPPGIGWCRGWQRDHASCEGAAPRREHTPEPESWERAPEAQPLRPGTAAPHLAGRGGPALPSLCAPAAWLAAYFPSWQASRCRQGNACGPACSGARGPPDPAEPPPGAEGLRMM